MHTRILLLVILCSPLTVGCQPKKGAQGPPPPPVVTVVKPIEYPVQVYYEYNGYLQPTEQVEIRARVSGILEKIPFAEGEEVTKGTLLYQIDPREYKAAVAEANAAISKSKADIASAQANVDFAQKELDRLRAINSSVARTELDRAATNLAAEKATKQAAEADVEAGEAALQKAKLNLEFTTIKAPIDGRINRTLVTVGNLVGQSEPTLLTTIIQMDPLFVYFDVAERDLIEYQRSAEEQTPLPSASSKKLPVEIAIATEEGYPHTGSINFLENRVNTGTGTVTVRGTIENAFLKGQSARQLYPGLFAKVRVPVGPEKPMTVIPEQALVTGQDGQSVYVLDKENKLVRRSVTVIDQAVYKARSEEQKKNPTWMLSAPKELPEGVPEKEPLPLLSVVAISKGLEIDDQVLVTGLVTARPGAEVRPMLRTIEAPELKK